MNIKELREALNISQQDLADATGIPRPRIGKWEQGKGSPKAEDYKKLESFFGEQIRKNEEQPSNNNLGNTNIDTSQPIIQVVLNLTYIGKKNADSIDRIATSMEKLVDQNGSNSDTIAKLVSILANSGVSSIPKSLLLSRHKGDDEPAEEFLKQGADVLRNQKQKP
jgi:transcriptional regulator with XRE-family HTH domain